MSIATNDVHKGYKVVKVIEDELLSIFVPQIFELSYSTECWTCQPSGQGPLCVFRNLVDAKWFVYKRLMNGTIYSCLYELSGYNKVWHYDSGHVIHSRSLCSLPDGTVLASKIKLMNEIADYDSIVNRGTNVY